jgi:hypothetical protein
MCAAYKPLPPLYSSIIDCDVDYGNSLYEFNFSRIDDECARFLVEKQHDRDELEDYFRTIREEYIYLNNWSYIDKTVKCGQGNKINTGKCYLTDFDWYTGVLSDIFSTVWLHTEGGMVMLTLNEREIDFAIDNDNICDGIYAQLASRDIRYGQQDTRILRYWDIITNWYEKATIAALEIIGRDTMIDLLEYYLRQELARFYTFVFFRTRSDASTKDNVALIKSMQCYFPDIILSCRLDCAKTEQVRWVYNSKVPYDIGQYADYGYETTVRRLSDGVCLMSVDLTLYDADSNYTYTNNESVDYVYDFGGTIIDSIAAFKNIKPGPCNENFFGPRSKFLPILGYINYNGIVSHNRVLLFLYWDESYYFNHIYVFYRLSRDLPIRRCETLDLAGSFSQLGVIKSPRVSNQTSYQRDIKTLHKMFERIIWAFNGTFTETIERDYRKLCDRYIKELGEMYDHILLQLTYEKMGCSYIGMLNSNLRQKLINMCVQSELFS